MSSGDGEVLILGGGLAGLCAMYTLSEKGRKVILVDREEEVGGLAKSRTYHSEHGDFSYDIGPHRLHTTDERVNETTLKVLGENTVRRDRMSRIFLYGKFFDYPLKLQKALMQLPKPVMARAIWDYFAQSLKNTFGNPGEDNFEDWVVKRFGRKLFNVFFGVYTEKTWGIPCKQISSAWASQRISQQSLWDAVKKSIFRPKGNVRSLVSSFYYPKEGGIGEIARSYARTSESMGATVHRATTVEKVLVEDGRAVGARVVDADGNSREIRADVVLNTMPCTTLIRLLDPPPPQEILDHVNALRHRSMVFVYLILDRPSLTPDHWIYIPEDTLTVHRLSEFKNFSDHCAPEGKTLICAEITCDKDDEVWNKSDDELRDIAVKDLDTIGLIGADEVLETFTHREVFAYPVYDLEYKGHLDPVLAHIESIAGLDTTGRQGLFKYNNMDHSIAMGFTAGDNLLDGGDDHKKIASGSEYFD